MAMVGESERVGVVVAGGKGRGGRRGTKKTTSSTAGPRGEQIVSTVLLNLMNLAHTISQFARMLMSTQITRSRQPQSIFRFFGI